MNENLVKILASIGDDKIGLYLLGVINGLTAASQAKQQQ